MKSCVIQKDFYSHQFILCFCNPYLKKTSIVIQTSSKPEKIGSHQNSIQIGFSLNTSNVAHSPYVPLSKFTRNPYICQKLPTKPPY